ncbi:glycosyltransferase [Frankia sp. CiP1_Cm_nod2]|uniref:glycosyltransferase n=1 Tax=Frankia sp. CiP1_Cm_nod2 TaxID=2897161 RepID=UPI0020243957
MSVFDIDTDGVDGGLGRLFAAGMIVFGLLYLATMLLLAAVHRPRRTGAAPEDLFFVFVLPCLNEEAVIGASLDRLLTTDAANRRVLVVDDGSDDRTSRIVQEASDARVWLLRRDPPDARQGKGAALNVAVAHLAAHPEISARDPDKVIIVVVDADGRLDPHAVETVAPCFTDARTGAVQIGVRINNRRDSLLARLQDMEFVIYTSVFQRGRGWLDNVGLGGNGQFVRLSALRSLGERPWSHSLTEDLDLGVRLLLAGWRNEFCPRADVHQQGVIRPVRLLRQRARWFQGHLQSWTLLPRVARHARPRALADMLFHLTCPLLILLASLLTLAFALGTAGVLTAWLTGGPAPEPAHFLGTYLLIGIPILVCALIYRSRERLTGFGLVRLIGYAHVYMLYALVWFVAGWWAVGRVAGHRTNWHKTARSPEAVTGAGPATAPEVLIPAAAAQDGPVR